MIKKLMNAKAPSLKFPYLTILLTILPVLLSIWGAVRSAASSEPDNDFITVQFVMVGIFSLTTLMTLAGWANGLVDEVKNLKSTIWELEGKLSRLKTELAQKEESNT
ncbi:MAG: hypothetical protein IPK32_08485 [Verrucomicrobiaceae bacterium]|nr:hypothetical protein [Verrucomicrobiaceae bacterium]